VEVLSTCGFFEDVSLLKRCSWIKSRRTNIERLYHIHGVAALLIDLSVRCKYCDKWPALTLLTFLSNFHVQHPNKTTEDLPLNCQSTSKLAEVSVRGIYHSRKYFPGYARRNIGSSNRWWAVSSARNILPPSSSQTMIIPVRCFSCGKVRLAIASRHQSN